MRWFRNLKTAMKLMLGFAVVGAIMAGVGLVGVNNMGKINETVVALYERDMAGIVAAKQAEIDMWLIARDIRQMLLIADQGEQTRMAQEIEAMERSVREHF